MFENHPGFEEAPINGLSRKPEWITDTGTSVEACPGDAKCRVERVLEAWCHCDFRMMEALKVNKFGRTYRTGTQVA